MTCFYFCECLPKMNSFFSRLLANQFALYDFPQHFFRNYLQGVLFCFAYGFHSFVGVCVCVSLVTSLIVCKGRRHSKPHSSQKMKRFLSFSHFTVSLCLSIRVLTSMCVSVSVVATFSVICLDYFDFVWLHTCRG